jgi:predicted  nucleic acid-binding Zn-ribbon protein
MQCIESEQQISLLMLPEISHRCPSCGASVRDRDALFCPDCGKPLAKAAKDLDETERAEAPTGDHPAPGEAKNSEAKQSPKPGAVIEDTDTRAKASVQFEKSPTPASAPRRGDKTRERLHRASAVARGVIEDEVKRVEKIRHVSTTIVEEASYDPSLRFVLVALGLFIVFVILLVLSKVMG